MNSIFECEYCERKLPKWMDTGGRKCTDCSDNTDTQQVLDEHRDDASVSETQSSRPPSQTTDLGFQRDGTGYQGSSEPEVVDLNDNESTKASNDLEVSPEANSESENESISRGPSRQDLSKDPTVQQYHQPTKPEAHQDLPDCDVFTLGEYFVDDYQRDAYSSRLIRLCKEGELSELPFFGSHLNTFFDQRLGGNFQPDLITVYPGHEGGVSEGLKALAEKVTEGQNFQHCQVLYRTEERLPQHRQADNRWDNQRGSIETQGNVDNKTVIVLDDICTSGASMTVAKHTLLEQGADRVIGICLGLSTNQPGEYVKRVQDEEHTIENLIYE